MLLGQESTAQLAGSLQELDRLLRVHRLAELAPLLRRALVSTWLLPDQVGQRHQQKHTRQRPVQQEVPVRLGVESDMMFVKG